MDGGGGILNKYQAKSTSLLIGKKGSFSAALSSNNLGKEILSLEDYIGSIIGLGGLVAKTDDIHPPKTGISVHFSVFFLMAVQNYTFFLSPIHSPDFF